MSWTESGTNFGALPATGAFYCPVGPKHVGDPYSEGRAVAVVIKDCHGGPGRAIALY